MGYPRNTPERLRATWREKYAEVLGCHEWLGSRSSNGYGKITLNYRTQSAHRLAYELFVGPIPEGQLVRHRCDNRCCVNPDHLELGTPADNMHDKVVRGRWRGRAQSFPGPMWPIFLRKLYDLGISQGRLATKFGVTRETINRTINR